MGKFNKDVHDCTVSYTKKDVLFISQYVIVVGSFHIHRMEWACRLL